MTNEQKDEAKRKNREQNKKKYQEGQASKKLKKEHDANNDEEIRMWLLKKSEAAIQRKFFVSQLPSL